MGPLIIDKTQDTPEVILDPIGGTFSFSGTSIPENAKKFYEPILIWVETFSKNPGREVFINFRFTYFNTASTKYIFDILYQFKEVAKSGNPLVINWYYHQEDEDMLEAGEGFSKMLRFRFNFV